MSHQMRLACCLLLSGLPLLALARVDPMRPPDAVDQLLAGEQPAGWTLGGILTSGGERRARINSSWARPGDVINGAKLLSIGDSSVELKKPDGKTLTLSLPRPQVKQPIKARPSGEPK